MKNFKPFFFTVVLVSAGMSLVCAQGKEIDREGFKKSYWLDMGLGWGGQGGAFNIGLSYELIQKRFISIRYSGVWTNDYCGEIVLLFLPIKNPMGKSADALEVSYGILKKSEFGLVTFSAGLSYVNVETAGGDGLSTLTVPVLYHTDCPDNYWVKNESTVGVVLRAQFIPSIRWGGIGISPYLNINPKYTFGAFTINVALGRLKARVNQ